MLDFALDTVIVFGFGYVVFGLAAHLAWRWNHPKGAIVAVAPTVEAVQAAEQQSEPIVPVAPTAPTEPEQPIVHVAEPAPTDRPTRRQLLALAKAARLPGYSRMTSDALAEALTNVRAIAS
jgi:hypothetical protein